MRSAWRSCPRAATGRPGRPGQPGQDRTGPPGRTWAVVCTGAPRSRRRRLRWTAPAATHHLTGGNILASLDNFLAETVEGPRAVRPALADPRHGGAGGGRFDEPCKLRTGVELQTAGRRPRRAERRLLFRFNLLRGHDRGLTGQLGRPVREPPITMTVLTDEPDAEMDSSAILDLKNPRHAADEPPFDRVVRGLSVWALWVACGTSSSCRSPIRGGAWANERARGRTRPASRKWS